MDSPFKRERHEQNKYFAPTKMETTDMFPVVLPQQINGKGAFNEPETGFVFRHRDEQD